jgi:hypothetical protein
VAFPWSYHKPVRLTPVLFRQLLQRSTLSTRRAGPAAPRGIAPKSKRGWRPAAIADASLAVFCRWFAWLASDRQPLLTSSRASPPSG